jgi:hypothetical protein
MRILKIFALVVMILASLSLLSQTAMAATVLPNPHPGGGGYHGGGGYYGGYHGGYGGYQGYYGFHYHYPYFYGYPYWGGFYPYFGLGFGYGYGYGAGYGYGYPYGGYGYGYEPYGEVRTEVKPQHAEVFVDGGLVGKADDYDGWWQRLKLSPGMHRLVFRSPGFQPYVTDIRVGIGTDFHMKYELHPGNDSISEEEMMLPQKYAQRGNDRRYDQRGYGHEPRYDYYGRPNDQRNRQYDQRDRQYERRPPAPPQENPDYNRDNNYDNDRDNDNSYYGDQQQENRQGDRRPLIVHVEPNDATIYIDGNYYGTANDNGNDLQVLLPEGEHRIEVVRPGFDTFSQNVTIFRDRDNHLNIILKRK